MALVIGMGVLIVAMVVLLFLGVTLGWGKKDKAPEAGTPAVPLPVGSDAASMAPAGDAAPLEITTAPESRLYTLAGDGARIALHIAAPTGDEIIVVDTAQNRVISRIRLKPEGGSAPP